MITKIKRVLARMRIGSPLNILIYDKGELPQYTPRSPVIRRGRPRGKYGKQIKREGDFGIQAGKIVTNLRFKTLEEAQTWGEWNYRGKGNWKVIEIKNPNITGKQY